MPRSMIALDFFLYDNRTWSPRLGPDWGLKAATGTLADSADLKAAFDRYCGAMLGVQVQLRGFGEAIGGMSSQSGYLLCVTLETSDSFGRPSWAVFGLWCPDRATLAQVLSAGDPIGSARALLGGEKPPSAIEIRPATVAAGPRRRKRASAEPLFYRFDPRSTVNEVITLLLVAIQQRTKLPDVLGITATSRFAAVAQSGFKVVYCYPMDDRTERALVRVLSPQEPTEELPSIDNPIQELVESVDRPEPKLGELRSQWPSIARSSAASSSRWPLWFSIPLGILVPALIVLLVIGFLPDRSTISEEPALMSSGDEPAPVPEDTPETSIPEARSNEGLLDDVSERLRECKKLAPDNLRRSSGFEAAETVPVLPEYQERRDRVRQAYAALIEIRGRMVKRQGNYVAYYFEEAGKEAPPATRLQKIAEILGEAPLGREDCGLIHEAFGFEFESGGSVVRRWCDTLRRLQKTAGALKTRIAPSTPPAPHPAPHAPAAASS